jgi:hypothetical protein
MKTTFYKRENLIFKVECFKDDQIDELTDNAYEIVGTSLITGKSCTLTTNVPQAAIALADEVMSQLNTD